MTEQEVKKFIAASVSADRSNSEELAGYALSAAISKLSRMPDVDWNRDQVDITLTSGDGEYILNSELLGDYPQIWNMEELWHTDSQSKPIRVVGLSEFNAYKRGNSSTGRPVMATIHSSQPRIEFYPIPDSNYQLWGYVQKEIKNFNDIPSIYHDVLVNVGQEFIRSMTDANMASKLAEQGINEIEGQSQTKWTGNTIDTSGNIGRTKDRVNRADSYNISGS